MNVEKKLMTVEEFEPYAFEQETQDRLLELIDGEVYEKMPTEEHGVVVLNLGSEIRIFLKQNRIGRAGVEVRHRMPEDRYNSRIPDLSFRADVSQSVVKKGSVLQMPDLAVEVFSPDDEYKDLRAKAAYYLANGSRLAWLLYPKSQTIEICRLNEAGEMVITTLGIHDALDGEDVLPGFSMPVREVFEG